MPSFLYPLTPGPGKRINLPVRTGRGCASVPSRHQEVTTVPPHTVHASTDPSDEHTTDNKTRTQEKPALMHSIDIQSFSYEERSGILPNLTCAFTDCGGWILDRKTISSTTLEFRVEIQLRAIVDLYAAILAVGIELTRDGHLGLTHLCTCRMNLDASAQLNQLVTIRLEVRFLDEITLHSLLNAGQVLA